MTGKIAATLWLLVNIGIGHCAAPVAAPIPTPTARPSTPISYQRFRVAPYYELVVSSNPSLSGLNYITFAFILSDSNNNPTVELTAPWASSQYSDIVINFQNAVWWLWLKHERACGANYG